jgi:hypothetical protein
MMTTAIIAYSILRELLAGAVGAAGACGGGGGGEAAVRITMLFPISIPLLIGRVLWIKLSEDFQDYANFQAQFLGAAGNCTCNCTRNTSRSSQTLLEHCDPLRERTTPQQAAYAHIQSINKGAIDCSEHNSPSQTRANSALHNTKFSIRFFAIGFIASVEIALCNWGNWHECKMAEKQEALEVVESGELQIQLQETR